MYHCPTCHRDICASQCGVCGGTQSEAETIAREFVEFLRTGRYERPEPKPPAPFRKRLASFVGCEESDVMRHHPNQSSMPLRIFAPIGPYIGAKATWFVRWILIRIRQAVGAR